MNIAAAARATVVVIVMVSTLATDSAAQATNGAARTDDAALASAGDEAQIRQLWATLDSLWNGRDAAAFSELFSEDASFVFVDRKQALDGRAGILEFFSAQFPDRAPELRHLTTITEIREIALGVHAVDGTVRILRVEPGSQAEPRVLVTFAIFAVMEPAAGGAPIRVLRIFTMPAAASGG